MMEDFIKGYVAAYLIQTLINRKAGTKNNCLLDKQQYREGKATGACRKREKKYWSLR